MKKISNNYNMPDQIKVRVIKVNKDTVDCKQMNSDIDIKAFYKPNMDISIGQVILIRFKKSDSGSAYIVEDTLINYIDGIVLEAQHFIQEDMLFTSVIIEAKGTKRRMHSLAASNTKLFGDTSLLIKGDEVKIKQNDGVVFGIQVINN